MTEEQEDRSAANIETCRRLNGKLARRCLAHNVTASDVEIAAVYSAFDLANKNGRGAVAAIEWMRSALDVMESQLLASARRG